MGDGGLSPGESSIIWSKTAEGNFLYVFSRDNGIADGFKE